MFSGNNGEYFRGGNVSALQFFDKELKAFRRNNPERPLQETN